MVSDGNDPTPFDPQVYDKAYEEIVQLKGRLSQNSVKFLAAEVVARLSRRVETAPLTTAPPTPETVKKLAQALVDEDRDAWTRVLSRPQVSGASLRAIYVDYLASAARQLGEWWEDDTMSFAEVTVGVGRIYAIMRSLRNTLPVSRPGNKYAVFAAVPGETHTLGVAMAADIFRQRGWQIDLTLGLDHDTLLESIEKADCHVIGLTASAPRHMVDLIRLIVALRVTHPDAIVLVSGPIVDREPDLLKLTGADFATSDLDQAIQNLEQAWDALPAG